MNLLEAIASGQPFRRSDWRDYWVVDRGFFVPLGLRANPDMGDNPVQCLDASEVIATDWEIASDRIEITRQALHDVIQEIGGINLHEADLAFGLLRDRSSER